MSSRIIRSLVWSVVLVLPALAVAAEPATQPAVSILAMGDWGSNTQKQRDVAATMGSYLKSSGRSFNAMLLCGDNFYVPLEGGIHDPKWRTMFEDLYGAETFNFPFYVSLGNHDYQIDRFLIEYAYSAANPQSRWKFPSRWYRVELPSPQNPLVTVIMLDSNLQNLGDPGWTEETKWLTKELAKPRTAPWLVAASHHPFFSNGDHGDIGPLREAWGPLFAKAGVDFVIAGHDHDLQHLQVEGYPESFLLVGGGGASVRPIRVDANKRGPFSKSTMGFADINFTPTTATARVVSGTDGSVLHEFTRTKDGKVDIVKAGDSDAATPRTVKSITRGGEEKPSSFNDAPKFAP